jgi:hypothetical protein
MAQAGVSDRSFSQDNFTEGSQPPHLVADVGAFCFFAIVMYFLHCARKRQ